MTGEKRCPVGHRGSAEIVAAVRHLIGMKFRPQGRGVDGIDCVGVLLVGAHAVGADLMVRSDYQIGQDVLQDVLERLESSGCLRLGSKDVGDGDILLSCPGGGQAHFAIKVPAGLVEAHLGLRRVVERPIGGGEEFHSVWRLPERMGG